MIKHLGHVALITRDFDVMKKFYVDVLGLREAFSLHNDDGSHMLTYIQVSEESFIELFPARKHREYPDPVMAGNFGHLCLLVEDLKETHREMEEKEIEITRGPLTGKDGNLQLWIKDPDGNPIEFMQVSPDSPQAKAAAWLRKNK